MNDNIIQPEKRETDHSSIRQHIVKLEEDKIEDVTIWVIIQNLLPNLSSSAITVFINLVEVHFIGQTADNKLYDGIGLAQVYMNVLIYYIGSGFTETLSIFCPKSFGSGKYKLLGIQTNQIRIIVTAYYLIIVLLNYFLCEIMLKIVIGEVSYLHITQTYIWCTLPAYFMSLHYDIYCKYSESQLVYKPIMISLIFSIIIHPFLCYFLIIVNEFGVYGAAIASNSTEFLKLVIMMIYFLLINPYPESNFFWDKGIFKKFWKITQLSTLTAVIFFSEYLGFSISSIFAAKLGELPYAKHIDISNINSINYVLSYAFLNTTAIIIGNYVGQNSPENIKKSVKHIIFLALGFETVIVACFIIYQKKLILFFSENGGVSDAHLNNLIIIMCIYGALDIFQAILQGILRGLSIIKNVTIYSLTLFLVVQPTLYYVFIYWLGLELEGIWMALVICLIVLNTIYLFFIRFRVNVSTVCSEYDLNISRDTIQASFDGNEFEDELDRSNYVFKINRVSRITSRTDL
jgi:MATE family multidrug resistance protein